MSFKVSVQYHHRKLWSDEDMCKCSTQSTSFSIDFETLRDKRLETLNQVTAFEELLGYLLDSMIMPHLYSNKCKLYIMLRSCLEVLNKTLTVTQLCSPTCSNTFKSQPIGFVNDQLKQLILANCETIKFLKLNFISTGVVRNLKVLDVICSVCHKVKSSVEKYLVHIKYWQVTGY